MEEKNGGRFITKRERERERGDAIKKEGRKTKENGIGKARLKGRNWSRNGENRDGRFSKSS